MAEKLTTKQVTERYLESKREQLRRAVVLAELLEQQVPDKVWNGDELLQKGIEDVKEGHSMAHVVRDAYTAEELQFYAALSWTPKAALHPLTEAPLFER